MRKTIYIIIFIFLLIGNNNYKDLNNLAIITNIGIIKNNDKYQIIYQEIIPKISNNKIKNEFKYYTNSSNSLKNAFYNLQEDITKEIYLEHLENIIIKSDDNQIIYNIDNFLKKDLDNFNIILTNNNPKEILKFSNNYKYINSIIPNNTSLRNIKKAKIDKVNIKLPVVNIKNNRLIFYKYKNIGVFNNG